MEKIPVEKYTDTVTFLTGGHSQHDLGQMANFSHRQGVHDT